MDSKRRIRCKNVFARRLRFPFPRYGTNQVIINSKQHNSLIIAVANMMLYNAMQCDVEALGREGMNVSNYCISAV